MFQNIFLLLASFFSLAAWAGPTLRPYDALSYHIRIEVDPAKNPSQFVATTEMVFKPTQRIASVQLDSRELEIQSVKLARRPLVFKTTPENTLEITLNRAYTAQETVTLSIRYQGKIRETHTGFFKVTDPDALDRGPLFFTHFEPLEARTFFPCNDQPHDKALTSVTATVPQGIEVISNGVKAKPTAVHRGKERWSEITWRQEKPHPTYLVALAIGKFAKVSTLHRGKEIAIYTAPEKTKKAQFVLQATKRAMEYLEKSTSTPYPWSKYAIVALPTFTWGGMENTSATFMNQDRTVLSEEASEMGKSGIVGLTAHELAHQWFGDLVTMKWWDDVWLNESFASYYGTMATADQFGEEQEILGLVTSTWNDYFRQEDGPRSHPIVNKDISSPDEAFDSVSYTKGENVLRMLQFYVGDESFRKGVARYLKRRAFSNADHMDFFSDMSASTKEDLTTFRNSWLLQRGYPIVSYAENWNASSKKVELTFTQKPNAPTDTSLFQFRFPVTAHRRTAPAYDKAFTVEIKDAKTVVQWDLPDQPEWVTVNPQGIALAKFVAVNADESALAKQALSDPDAVARVWAALQLMEPLNHGKGLSQVARATLMEFSSSDTSPHARVAVLTALRRTKTRALPEDIGQKLVELAQTATSPAFAVSPQWQQDTHGWRIWRSTLLGVLGKVEGKQASQFLSEKILKGDMVLDDLSGSTQALAMTGTEEAKDTLQKALQLYSHQGYSYRFVVLYAFGAFESPIAVSEIEVIAQSATADLFGRLGRLIRDNQTLKNSSEWATFLKNFVLKNDRFSDEIKSRILSTIEEVKTPEVRDTLEVIQKESSSARMKEVSKKILDKNFLQTAS